eukprot:1193444-Rhodomonas_salina.1
MRRPLLLPSTETYTSVVPGTGGPRTLLRRHGTTMSFTSRSLRGSVRSSERNRREMRGAEGDDAEGFPQSQF